MRVVILGAGISGHTAALVLRRRLPKKHEVVVVTPNSRWNWIPSNIWVGVGKMSVGDVTFELAPVYAKKGIRYEQGKATEIHPEGNASHARPFVVLERTDAARSGERVELEYDYLINATGPRLNFGATPGLGPEGNSLSVCTAQHAKDAADALAAHIDEMAAGARKTIVVGMGHGTCTCEGAAFEYVFNLEFELRQRGVRDRARIVYLTNEAALGDFGVGGLQLTMGGYTSPSQLFTESLFVERGIEWVLGAHVERVEPNLVRYETLDGVHHELAFDFAMLLPPFGGVPLKAFDRTGADITSELFAPNGFMRVDADYTPKTPDQWKPADWPERYVTRYENVFAIGIAFAPPHPISMPRKTVNGTPVTPSPPRTGMPSAIMGRTVAHSISDMILHGATTATRGASMAAMGAACVASAGANRRTGTAASMTMFPIIPDFDKYPTGRDEKLTTGELGLAGHWIKRLLHSAFLYKAKAKWLWWMIPE